MDVNPNNKFTKLLFKAKEAHLNGNLELAISEYTFLLKSKATADLRCLLGWAHCLNGNFSDAIKQCKLAIELDPNFGNAYNDLACYLIYEKRLDAAIPWLEKAIQLEDYTGRHLSYYNLGRVYEKKGLWQHAKIYYEYSVSISPEYKKANEALYKIYTYLN